MTKITPDHLARSAYVYVRQSTLGQMLHNPESRRRQYALPTRARALGWEKVVVIDDDLGRSGGGTARPSFERLLAAICEGRVGAVFAIEASRLARNGRDWHALLEFCALLNTLIIDEDAVYTMVPGSVRSGDALLVGLLRCGHWGRKLKVRHHARRDARYHCDAEIASPTGKRCIAFSNARVDAAVSAEVLGAISPLAIEAVLQSIADHEGADAARLRQMELALEQARYEAARAHRQYDAVDPDNRLVASDLERRWNEKLGEMARLEEEMRVARDTQAPALTEAERREMLALATDLPRLWNHPAASPETRKRILRAVLKEIIVTVAPGRLHLVLHWQGGDHTRA